MYLNDPLPPLGSLSIKNQKYTSRLGLTLNCNHRQNHRLVAQARKLNASGAYLNFRGIKIDKSISENR